MAQGVSQGTYLLPRLVWSQLLGDRAKLYRRFADPQETEQNRILHHPPLEKIALGQLRDILENPADILDDIPKPARRLTGRQ